MLQNAKYTLPHVLVHVNKSFPVVVRFCQKNMLSIKLQKNPSKPNQEVYDCFYVRISH